MPTTQKKKKRRGLQDPKAHFGRYFYELFGPLKSTKRPIILAQDLKARCRGSKKLDDPFPKFQAEIEGILIREAKARERGKSSRSLERALYEEILDNGVLGQIDALLLTYIYYLRVLTKITDTDQDVGGRNLRTVNNFWKVFEGNINVAEKHRTKDLYKGEKLPILSKLFADKKLEWGGKALVPAPSIFKVLCAILLTDIGARNLRLLLLELLRNDRFRSVLSAKKAFQADIDEFIKELERDVLESTSAMASAGPEMDTGIPSILSMKGTLGKVSDAAKIGGIIRMRSIYLEKRIAKSFATLINVDTSTAKKMIVKRSGVDRRMLAGAGGYGAMRYGNLVIGLPSTEIQTIDKIGSTFAATVRGTMAFSDRSKVLLDYILKSVKNPKVKIENIDNMLFELDGKDEVGEIVVFGILTDLAWPGEVELNFWEGPGSLRARLDSLRKSAEDPTGMNKVKLMASGAHPDPRRYDYEVVSAQVLKGLFAIIERETDTMDQMAYAQAVINKMRELQGEAYPKVQFFKITHRWRASRILKSAYSAEEDILGEDYVSKKVVARRLSTAKKKPKA